MKISVESGKVFNFNKEKTMSTTSQKQDCGQGERTHISKNFTETAPVEQLSATTECEKEIYCSREGLCEDAIREKAYLLWEAAGSPIGDGVDFWLQAEQVLSK